MTRLRFSPLEETVLQLLGEQWYTLGELKQKLFPEHAPQYVKSAVNYLRDHELVVQLPREHSEPYLESTELGRQVLADYRRARTPLHADTCRVG
jgi:hypothetical protein